VNYYGPQILVRVLPAATGPHFTHRRHS